MKISRRLKKQLKKKLLASFGAPWPMKDLRVHGVKKAWSKRSQPTAVKGVYISSYTLGVRGRKY